MTPDKHTPAPATSAIVRALESFMRRYVIFTTPDYAFAAALWVIGTYLWDNFDAFPYLVITSATKRSGKTRFAEVLAMLSRNPRQVAAMTASAMYRSIATEDPTFFIDEAEDLASGAAGDRRAVLNVGYRKGGSIQRTGPTGDVVSYPAYCPKAFILIGDVFDTLRDRSIIVVMRRAAPTDPLERFRFDVAKGEAGDITTALKTALEAKKAAILDAYAAIPGLDYLPDRDEELWLPLTAICQVMCPERLDELTRVSVDMATEKTVEARSYVNLAGAEDDARNDEYASRLLHDLLAICGTRKAIGTADALAALHAAPTMPWRKFRGDGLNAISMAQLLNPLGVNPRVNRTPGGRKGSTTMRGYNRADIEKAIEKHFGKHS